MKARVRFPHNIPEQRSTPLSQIMSTTTATTTTTTPLTTARSAAKVISWIEDRTLTTTPRVTPASVKLSLLDLSGQITSAFIMAYTPGGDASFVFTDIVEADNFQGKKGSFITQGKGTYAYETRTCMGEFDIVPGSGTGQLSTARGKGTVISAPTEADQGLVEYTFVIT
jgi:hypothetical protein